ncbi:CbtB domain-containing protein [Profundibacterium mesophilum]|uniref:Cobalt transporter subunit domain containing protein n=1 Tax=Profundibacterium mesophilum KAUST100406-0324 TaxID=1037889 RepID=A0A921TCS9_9RHOB|nr:CbtB domain-containing protein [Profundibacterium mesophilum]KAF0675511.1 putative cobalt transporter subunit domain containing protein [Profundibacterium mesophilum KAUST100406-0324]
MTELTRRMTLAAPLSGRALRHMAILSLAVIGLGIVGVAGNLQAASLHDAAHDVRHATGFPCH